MSAEKVISELKSLAKQGKAADLARFFKTGPGEYGEGDIFMGVMVPQTRSVAKGFESLELSEIEKLFKSAFHEARLCGAIILTMQFEGALEAKDRKKLFTFYMKQMKAGRINNWDLVDVTAPRIGVYLTEIGDPIPFLIKLSQSKSLWERRVSIIFTFAFIRVGDLDPSITIAELLLNDSHDLIHKAVGWVLREVGKRDVMLLRQFLTNHSHEMPRTMLRYSIEKLPERERKKWLLDSKG